jgi:hypothetical protein
MIGRRSLAKLDSGKLVYAPPGEAATKQNAIKQTEKDPAFFMTRTPGRSDVPSILGFPEPKRRARPESG